MQDRSQQEIEISASSPKDYIIALKQLWGDKINKLMNIEVRYFSQVSAEGRCCFFSTIGHKRSEQMDTLQRVVGLVCVQIEVCLMLLNRAMQGEYSIQKSIEQADDLCTAIPEVLMGICVHIMLQIEGEFFSYLLKNVRSLLYREILYFSGNIATDERIDGLSALRTFLDKKYQPLAFYDLDWKESIIESITRQIAKLIKKTHGPGLHEVLILS